VRGYAATSFLCGLLLAGCGSSSAPKAAVPTLRPSPAATVARPMPSNSTTLPTAATPAVTPSRFQEPYANAFEDFWSAYARADRDGDPNSPQLAQVATGAALVWARSQIEAHVKLGVAHRGGAAFRSVGADHVTSTSALIGQCMDWSTWPVVNRRTGAIFQEFAVYSQLVDSRMAFADNRWRVATVRVRDVPC
jgi:hypothetical protein